MKTVGAVPLAKYTQKKPSKGRAVAPNMPILAPPCYAVLVALGKSLIIVRIHYGQEKCTKVVATLFSNSCTVGQLEVGAGKFPNTYDTESESLGEDEVGRSARPSFFSSTPCPLQRGQELRPVVSH